MFHQQLQQYSCDRCERMIPKSEPVQIAPDELGEVRHFCQTGDRDDCRLAYQRELVADLAGAYS
jgi:hypothetical protein